MACRMYEPLVELLLHTQQTGVARLLQLFWKAAHFAHVQAAEIRYY